MKRNVPLPKDGQNDTKTTSRCWVAPGVIGAARQTGRGADSGVCESLRDWEGFWNTSPVRLMDGKNPAGYGERKPPLTFFSHTH